MSSRANSILLAVLTAGIVFAGCEKPHSENSATPGVVDKIQDNEIVQMITERVDKLLKKRHTPDRKLTLGKDMAQSLKDSTPETADNETPDLSVSKGDRTAGSLRDVDSAAAPEKSDSDKTSADSGNEAVWLTLIAESQRQIERKNYSEAVQALLDAMPIAPGNEAKVITTQYLLKVYILDSKYSAADAYAIEAEREQRELGNIEHAELFQKVHEMLDKKLNQG